MIQISAVAWLSTPKATRFPSAETEGSKALSGAPAESVTTSVRFSSSLPSGLTE
jgi:hypothetical protein